MLSRETVGSAPVASAYRVPVCLSATAAKQKILFASLDVYLCPLLWKSDSDWKIDGAHFAFFGFDLVLLMPARGFFMRPSVVAGDGGRYFCIMLESLRNWVPFSWLFWAASMMVVIGAPEFLMHVV